MPQAFGKAYAYDDSGLPFSKWKPAAKFVHVFAELYPKYWAHCETEWPFEPSRAWRFDYAWPAVSVAVEIDGYGPGHTAMAGISSDHEKQNAAILEGWRVFRFTAKLLGSIEGVRHAVHDVARCLEGPDLTKPSE